MSERFRYKGDKRIFLIYLLPLLYLILYALLFRANGAFYLTRIDPDYVYLLNGLNCSIFHFDRIGHLDHPGTPFQLFLGVLIRIIHFLSGQQDIIDDVLQRPEHYLNFCSHLLALVFFCILIWAGKIAWKESVVPALLLQSTPFLSAVIPDLSVRLMPDRFGFMLAFLLVVLLINSISSGRLKTTRDMILIGLITGLTIATKITFLPVLVLPLLILEKKIPTILYTSLGFLLGILPIFNRFDHFSQFINKLLYHDGIYGGGEEKIIDPEIFIDNLTNLTLTNPLLFITCVMVGILFFTGRTKNDSSHGYTRFLIGYMIVVLATSIMVAKHFKNYYMIGALILVGPAIFALYQVINAKKIRLLILALAGLFSSQTLFNQIGVIKSRTEVVLDRETEAAILEREWGKGDYLFIQPEWAWGPAKEYGLIFGLSYVRHRDKFAENIRATHFYTLSYEGVDRDPMRMRVDQVPLEELEEKQILIVDQPQRNAASLVNYIQNRYLVVSQDTVPMSSDLRLIKLKLSSAQSR